MVHEFFVVKDQRGLKCLPPWLLERDYNLVCTGLKDKKNIDLVGLQHKVGTVNHKAGLICVYDPELIGSVVDIAKQVPDEEISVIDCGSQENRDQRFMALYKSNLQIMEHAKALRVTCLQQGIDMHEGEDIINGLLNQEHRA